MEKMSASTAAIALLVSSMVKNSSAFYLPGVTPQSFGKGDPIKVKVNSLTSVKTLLPIDYYKLPFCKPALAEGQKKIKLDHENLGEFLTGDRIEPSPYVLRMQEDMFCEVVCSVKIPDFSDINEKRSKNKNPPKLNRAEKAISQEYHHNIIVDNLNAASQLDDGGNVKYWQGFPVGGIDEGLVYINNHFNFFMKYHPVENETGKHRIVGFVIEPVSIRHEFSTSAEGDITIINPVPSCNPNRKKVVHTNWHAVVSNNKGLQPAAGDVLFTYDVTWEKSDISWATRWDVYLNMANVVPAKVHWFNIINSFFVVAILSFMLAAILVRNLKRDFQRYNKLPTSDEEKADELEDFGWKLVHADVFRPPSNNPMAFAVMVGSGMQLLLMGFFTIIFSILGFLSPANRGSLIIGQLVFYALMGSVSGYVTARLYKSFKGKAWQTAMILAATAFPGFSFSVFFVLDITAAFYGSTDAVPFTTMLVLLILWFGISTPLVFLGAYFGYKKDVLEYPVNTSSIPRQIPDQEWYTSIHFAMVTAGIVPFSACFVEFYFILSSVWMDQYYHVFTVLFLVFLILLILSMELAVLFNYFQLCCEDYNWWWRSFGIGGSSAIYTFLYSCYYFQKLQINTFATYVLYFGYTSISTVALFLVTGSISALACLAFNLKIFGSIKVD